MEYIDIKQRETYEKLKNRGWYSAWYWYFINANNNNDDNTPASTVTANATTNDSNNYDNNNVILIKIITTIKMRSGCTSKKIKSSYIYCSPHFLFGEKNVP